MPRKIISPRPPAPTNVAIVAAPIATTAATRTPAKIIGIASGIMTMRKSWPDVMPMPVPASIMFLSTPVSPAYVLAMIGSIEYSARATMAVS